MSSRVDQSAAQGAAQGDTNLAFEDSDDGSQFSEDERRGIVNFGSDGEIYLRLDLDLNENSNDQNRDDALAVAPEELAPVPFQNENIDAIEDALQEWNFVDYEELLEDIHEYDHHTLDEAERANLFLSHGIIKRPSGTILRPNHAEYKMESKRLASFNLWPGGENKIINLIIR